MFLVSEMEYVEKLIVKETSAALEQTNNPLASACAIHLVAELNSQKDTAKLCNVSLRSFRRMKHLYSL